MHDEILSFIPWTGERAEEVLDDSSGRPSIPRFYKRPINNLSQPTCIVAFASWNNGISWTGERAVALRRVKLEIYGVST